MFLPTLARMHRPVLVFSEISVVNIIFQDDREEPYNHRGDVDRLFGQADRAKIFGDSAGPSAAAITGEIKNCDDGGLGGGLDGGFGGGFGGGFNDGESDDEDSYSGLPKKFIGCDTWPQTMCLPCWGCDLFRDVCPRFVPLRPVINLAGDYTCEAYGHFCSWPCAAGYIDAYMYKYNREELHEHLTIFESLYSGVKKIRIPAAPPRTIMKKYSGPAGITEDDYCDILDDLMSCHTTA